MSNPIAIWRAGADSEASLLAVELVPPPTTLDLATRQLPSGGYTTFRTYNQKQVLRFTDHLKRLEFTAAQAGQPVRLDEERIRQALRKILRVGEKGEVRVRIILDLERQPGSIYYLVAALQVPLQEEYERGVKAVTRTMQRTKPEAKLTNFVQEAESVREQLPANTNEALMVSGEGLILEGLSSNFFGVQKAEVWTAEQGILPGITRSMALEVIEELGIGLNLSAVPIEALRHLEEAFITSASRAVLPVTTINNYPVGNGLPGPLTLKILDRFQKRIESELEII